VVESRGSAMRALGYGRIRNKPDLPHSQCLLNIRSKIDELCASYAPESAAIEGAFFAKNANTAMILGEARGAAIASCAAAGVPIFEYSPRKVKQALVGSGSVSKVQVAAMVKRILGISEDLMDDESDALAIAICHLQRNSSIPGLAVEPI
jgi:crossover junction endodeoxyribonuclease RuvC